MDILRDILEFVARLAWPVVVAGALYWFREPIKQKLESTTKASGFGISAEFAQKVSEQTKLGQTAVEQARPYIKDEDIQKLFGRLEAANTAVSSTLSGMLRVTEAPDKASFTGKTTGE